MKKLLLPLVLSLAMAATAAAAPRGEVSQGDRYDFKYPVFTEEAPKAASRINNDIQKHIEQTRKLLKDDEMQTVGSNFYVVSETDAYISLNLVTWEYRKLAAHPSSYTHGLVYDKATGKSLPYTHFTKKLDAKQLKQDILDKKLTVYCADLETTSEAPFLKDCEHFAVSKDYQITADGSIYLIYQPYDLDCYAAGPTFVKIK